MSVENVHVPNRVEKIDPSKEPEREPEDVTELTNELKKTRIRRELVQEQKLTENAQNPPQPPSPPFEVRGGIDIGTINLQEREKQLREDAALERQEAQARVTAAEEARDKAKDELAKAQIDNLRQSLGSQIQQLQNSLQAGNKGDFASELEKIDALATRLGYSKVSQAGGSSQIDLAIKKIELEIEQSRQSHERQMKQDDREWELKLEELKLRVKESEDRVKAERDKWSFIAQLPEQVGGVMMKGLLARGANGGIATQPEQKTASTNPQMRFIEAGVNEAGEIECQVCKSLVGVGPTTDKTACASCGQIYGIKRATGNQPQKAAVNSDGFDVDGRGDR